MLQTSAQKILETMEFHSQIKNLEEELSCLSSSFMVEEKESLIKELDKTKLNLQEIAFKLQIDIQQKTKLEVKSVKVNFYGLKFQVLSSQGCQL